MQEILNFHRYSDALISGGQPTEEQLKSLAGNGCNCVVNLAMHDSDNAIPGEGNIVASLGMSYIHMPVPFDAPTAGHLKTFFKLMDALEGQQVFVHCALNARVSVFMYKYLTLRKSLGEEESTSPLLAQWRPGMDSAWQSIMALAQGDLDY